MKTSPESAEPGRTALFDQTVARQYTLEDGLAGMLVEDIHQDRRGLLWVATADGGVSRFDGETFENFGLSDGLPHLTVMKIAEDADGCLWFGTLGGGLAAFDGRRFRVFTTEDGLPSNEILDLQPQADGSVLVLGGGGIARFAGGRCVERTTEIGGRPLGRVHDLAADSAGRTWLASRNLGVISLDGRIMSPVFGVGGAHSWAWKFARDGDGHLWIASRHGNREPVVGRYDPRDQRLEWIEVEAAPEAAKVVASGIRHLRLDARGWLWMARRGVLVYDGRDWHSFSERFPHVDFGSTRLTYEDRDGSVWVGTYGAGLVHCHMAGVRKYGEADGLPHPGVQCLAEDHEGRIWIGTETGLACLEEGRLQSLGTAPRVTALRVDRGGTLWIGDAAGRVLKKRGADPQLIAELARDGLDRIIGICEDRAGRLWFGTSRGLLGCIEEDRFFEEERFSADPSLRRCSSMVQDSGGLLWIGTSGGDPALYHKDGAHRFHGADLSGLEAVTDVSALCEQAGTLWVGTAIGLFAVDLRSRKVRRISVDGGVWGNSVLSLATDRQGGLWVGTCGGGALYFHGGTFHRIRLGDSTLENTVRAIHCDRRGGVWFGTGGGLFIHRPRQAPPGIVICQAGRRAPPGCAPGSLLSRRHR